MRQTCSPVSVIGGGLSGAEAAWQLARRGFRVKLFEMRPNRPTPAHETGLMGELVCSNSLGGDGETTPAGILKAELRRLESLVMACAEKNRVPAGKALAVDREGFARSIDEALSSHPLIEVVREEVTEIPDEPAIIATGPLTSPEFAEELKKIVGEDFLYFYDAVAPIVACDSIDPERSFRGARYGNEKDYINCPMDEETYKNFWRELVNAERAPLHEFEKKEEALRCFEGCLPVEVIASRGEQTLLFGPLKPVGLELPEGGRPFAVVQLRQDNADGTLYNMVGFQTNLKWGEQERIFRMIPALENAEFVRKGVMHKNLFVCAPAVLDGFLRPRGREALFLAGQMTGVEGYVESVAMGMASAIFASACLFDEQLPVWPIETAIGSLLNYLTTALPESFQPMNVNLGIFPKLPGKKIHKKSERCAAYSKRSMLALEAFMSENESLFNP